MAQTAMGPDEVAFLSGHFARYYSSGGVVPPARFGAREFGFIPWNGTMMRHQGFSKADELRTYMARRTPAHAYHSTAYYKEPAAPTMEKKGWLGADLIFDLDADHLEGAEEMTYAQQLEKVKEELLVLIEDFLMRDFGYGKDDMRVVFSGGRGYHVHIRDPKVLGFTTHERREVVDYITGVGVDESLHFRKKPFRADKGFQGRVKVQETTVMPSVDAPGWTGRFARGVIELVREMEAMPEEEALEFLAEADGIGETLSRKVWDSLFLGEEGKRGCDKIYRNDSVDIFRDDKTQKAFMASVVSRVRVHMHGEADEPVTTDIKRLIRLEGSLHGKTGLRVTGIDLGSFASFDPLVDAIPVAFKGESAVVYFYKKSIIIISGEENEYDGKSEVPLPVAVFAVSRGMAGLDKR